MLTNPFLSSPPACNCSGRSEECFYDPELFRSSGHGGHCRHCRDNTAGPRCERCRQNHYRWEPRAACQPCHCHPAGAWGAAGHGEGVGGKGLVGDVPSCLSQRCCTTGFGQAQLRDGVGLWKGSGRGLRPEESMWP